MKKPLASVTRYGFYEKRVIRIGKRSRKAWVKSRRFLSGFAAAKQGVVAVIVALTMIPLLLATGVSIDVGRAYLVKQRLLSTTDAAGLAIAASIKTDSTSDELQAVLDNFLTANFPSGSIGTLSSSSYTYDSSTVSVSAAVAVETTFMKLIFVETLTVNASSQVTRQEDNLEVVLVLDNSGSMSGSKMTALKSAANSLLDTLFGSDATSSQVKIGLVPFSNNVNIGAANTGYVSDTSIYDWGTDTWKGCVEAEVAGNEDTNDNFTGPWTPFYWEDDSNNNWYYSGSSHISSSRGPNLYCPDAEITPLTNVKATLTAAVDAMVANGGTHINWGAIWGWRVISPSEPFTEGAAYGTADSTKAVIILTDGANTAYDFVYDAFGYPSEERLGSGINTATEVADEIDIRLATICQNMKTAGVVCQRRSKSSPLGRSKTSPLDVKQSLVLRVVPVVHRRDPR
ncbi:MAG: VWA domain-containing protein, partial [Rhodospirillales bacterium]|nr:VWA domain-containing protein [Rhodospirillales bacterium]